jgi:hypothetical protein
MEFRRTNQTGGYDGLQKAGVATLSTSEEIREVVDRIVAHAEQHPLGGPNSVLYSVDVKKFFDFAAKNKINFHRTEIQEVIERSKA